MTPGRPATLTLRVPPHPDLCRIARRRIADFARAKGIGDADLAAILTAAGEALANAVEHGRSEAPLSIECTIAPDRIVVTIGDGGVGFDCYPVVPGELPEPEAERGRGLALMRRFSDIFSVQPLPGGGTVVVLGRYRRDALTPPTLRSA
jgi:anti-sigma regulatory factor (Ser/Thr protein kinase)